MHDQSRLEALRRRVQQDPASIAFAQLAEEYRRAARFQDAVTVCRAGLDIHPGYLSARVTLGRALIELDQLADAQRELELKSAQENFAAVRGLAEIFHRRGELKEALAQYQAALHLAPNDPDLVQTVQELTRRLAPAEVAPAEVAPVPPPAVRAPQAVSAARARVQRTIVALERWLDAIHVARAPRHA
jgi:tetratricopeptide (TPR) repeat protein